jgi:hypothetical protein
VTIFSKGDYSIHNGRVTPWRIIPSSFSDEDWECFAQLIAERFPNFEKVIGVSQFGVKLESHLSQYSTHGGLLIVDDVLYPETMNKMRLYFRTRKKYVNYDIQGFTVFARVPCPSWIRALWQLDVRVEEWTQFP